MFCFALGTLKSKYEAATTPSSGIYAVSFRPISKWTSKSNQLGKVRAVWPKEWEMDKSDAMTLGYFNQEKNRFNICARIPEKPSIQSQYLKLADAHLSACDSVGRGFLKGISTGDKSQLSKRDIDVFRKAGLAHILAVSGYHVGLVGFIPLLLIRSRRRIIRGVAAVGLVAIWAFIVACGSPVSAVRAGIMISLGFFSFWLDRKALPFNALAVSAWVIAIIDSRAFTEVGTWLSYAATAGILSQVYSSKLIMLRIPIAAQTATLPIIAHTFQQLPIWFLPLNVIASLAMTIIGVLLGASLLLPEAVTYASNLSSTLINYLHKLSEVTPLSFQIENAYAFNAGALAGYAWLFSPVLPIKLSQIISYSAVVMAIFEVWIKFI